MWPPSFESPVEIETRCPACPDLPGSYVTQWCIEHRPSMAGPDDEVAKTVFGDDFIGGTAEAGGSGNMALCESVHRPTGAAPR